MPNRYQPRGSKDKLIKSVKEAKGSLEVLSDFISAKESEDDSTLIDIKVTNPLKRIYTLLQDIKKHQSTTFSLRFTIPLIALPIFLFVAFQLGRGSYVCSQNFTSKKGIIKNLQIDAPIENRSVIDRLFNFTSNSINIENIGSEYIHTSKAVLDVNNELIDIISVKSIDLTKYENNQVIVSGIYSSCSNTMTLNSNNNIVTY